MNRRLFVKKCEPKTVPPALLWPIRPMSGMSDSGQPLWAASQPLCCLTVCQRVSLVKTRVEKTLMSFFLC